MEDKHLVEPDLAFIDAVMKNGGESLKKCFQFYPAWRSSSAR